MSITFGMDGDIMGDVMETITTREGNISDTAHAVMQPLGFSGRGDGSDALEGITPTMRSLAQGADGHQSGSAGLAVATPIAIQDVRPIEKMQNGRGWNDDGTAYTVDTHATQGVAQPIGIFQDSEFGVAQYDSAGTLRAGRIPEHQMVMQPMVLMDQGGSVMNVEHDMVGTLRRETHGHEPAVIQPPSMAVRRLTPVECERLQGFPDNYTNIPWRKKPESPDGPRYKALGNSWAVPVVAWIGKRINEAVK
jgi:site-specific DNA-cytosine methylase